jgi:hypothetical protein
VRKKGARSVDAKADLRLCIDLAMFRKGGAKQSCQEPCLHRDAIRGHGGLGPGGSQVGASQGFAVDCQKLTLHYGFRQRPKLGVILLGHPGPGAFDSEVQGRIGSRTGPTASGFPSSS